MENKLFVVTNRKLIKKGSLSDVVKAAVKGGADAVILREKDLGSCELYKLALELKNTTDNKIPLIINGDAEAAEKAAASGLHLSYDIFMNCKNIKQEFKGASIHSLEEGIKVQQKGADYVLAGHIFNTACKKGLDGRGLGYLEGLCDKLNIPVIAIGGIELSNVKSVLASGTFGIAVMSSVMEADEPEKIVYELKQRMMH